MEPTIQEAEMTTFKCEQGHAHRSEDAMDNCDDHTFAARRRAKHLAWITACRYPGCDRPAYSGSTMCAEHYSAGHAAPRR